MKVIRLLPNTNLKKRLKDFESETGNYKEIITPPINKLDKGALEHDILYSIHKDLTNRHKADKKLIKIAEEVLNDNTSTKIQKFNAGLVKFILESKVKLGIGIDKGIHGSAIGDVNELIKQAQQASQTHGKTDIAHIIAPLLFIASSVGIPAIIKLFADQIKKKKGNGLYDDLNY